MAGVIGDLEVEEGRISEKIRVVGNKNQSVGFVVPTDPKHERCAANYVSHWHLTSFY